MLKDSKSNTLQGQIDAPNAQDKEDLNNKGFILKLARPSSNETKELPPPNNEMLQGVLVVGIIKEAKHKQKVDKSTTSVAFLLATFLL